jgi:hypothetical protein
MLLKLLIFLVSVCKLYCTITFLILNPKKLTNTSLFVKKLNFSSSPLPTTLAPFDCTVKNPTSVRILILDMRFLWLNHTYKLKVFLEEATSLEYTRFSVPQDILYSTVLYCSATTSQWKIGGRLCKKRWENKCFSYLRTIKGTMSRDFWPLVFFANRLPLGHRWTP